MARTILLHETVATRALGIDDRFADELTNGRLQAPTQFSSLSPRTRPNSRWLFVTNVDPRART